MATSKDSPARLQQTATKVSQSLARLDGVSVTFQDGTRAVDSFSLKVAPGECLGILGPNGAGKTTLLRLLAGLLAPSQGIIELFGLPIRREDIASRRRIGYVAQRSGVDEYLTGRGNLLLAGRLHSLRGDALRQRAQVLLELLGLAEHANRRVAHYSGGMRRRLALACSLIHHPHLLLLDEPTSGFDTAGKAALWGYLAKLQQAGLTIIASSHDTQEVERFCGRIVLMNQGRLILEGTPAALKAQIQGDMVTIEPSEPSHAATARFLLQPHQLVHAVHSGPAEGQLSLEVADGPEAIPHLARLLETAGVPLRRITLSHPTLEDVFFHATRSQLASASPLCAAQHPTAERDARQQRSPFRHQRTPGEQA
jgi:ABC-2 type transport system ATP-binding protein